MNKILKITLCFILMSSLCACSDNTEEVAEEKKEVPSEVDKRQTLDELPEKLYEDHLVSYTVDVPSSGVRYFSTGYSTSLGEDKFIVFDKYLELAHDDFGYSLDDIKQPSDIVSKMKKQIIAMIFTFNISTNAKDLVIESEKNMKINGYEFTKTKAYIETDPFIKIKDNKLHLVIYSTIKNGYPLYIAGVDFTKEQASLDEVEKYTDMVVQTFRELETE